MPSKARPGESAFNCWRCLEAQYHRRAFERERRPAALAFDPHIVEDVAESRCEGRLVSVPEGGRTSSPRPSVGPAGRLKASRIRLDHGVRM
jgi:hypothetical protein